MNRRSFLSGGAAMLAPLLLHAAAVTADAKTPSTPAPVAFGEKELKGFWEAIRTARVQGWNSGRGQASIESMIEAINTYTAKHKMTWPITFRHTPKSHTKPVEAIFTYLRIETQEGDRVLLMGYRIRASTRSTSTSSTANPRGPDPHHRQRDPMLKLIAAATIAAALATSAFAQGAPRIDPNATVTLTLRRADRPDPGRAVPRRGRPGGAAGRGRRPQGPRGLHPEAGRRARQVGLPRGSRSPALRA